VYNTILVPLDGSEIAASMLEQVSTLARGYGARLLLLTVGPTLPGSYLERLRTILASEDLEVETGVVSGTRPAKFWR
jgi:nucleotide-binding universal stress UspA family protein